MKVSFDDLKFRKLVRGGLHLAEAESDLTANNLYLEKGGEPFLPAVGEFHFARYPRDQWDNEVKKIKAGGINVISTYLVWIYHEETEGQFDFTGDKDLRAFLQVCQDNDMLVLLRVGPFIHGEVVYAGLPEWIQRREDKRTSAPAYLEKVRRLYRAYYEQSKDYFYQNGSVVIAIQLENEYGGKDREYLPALRRIAVEEGFRLPLYTITAWPPNGRLDGDMIPTFGRYLDRPWVRHTKPLPIDNRFHICRERLDKGIGADILLDVVWEELPYDDFPYATCELGIAVQPYEHRRPIISDRDGYAMGVIQLAQGVNWMGYYLYHGCRNQIGRYQESRSTGSPNDVPISSYDFETAISEYGYLRPSYHRFRLLHLMMSDYRRQLAGAQPFFCKPSGQEIDYKLSVRMNEDGSGYLFINNHQRLEEFQPIEDLDVTVHTPDGVHEFPGLNVPSGVCAILPIHQAYGPLTVEYMTAQPVCYDEKDGVERYYFFVPDGLSFRGLLRGPAEMQLPAEEMTLTPNYGEAPVLRCTVEGKTSEYYLLTEARARMLYKLDGRVFFSPDMVLERRGEDIRVERILPEPEVSRIALEEIPHTAKSGEDYLFSEQPAKEYRLYVPKDSFRKYVDWKVTFHLVGNVAQLYCGGVLMADWFNYNETWEVGLRRFRQQIEAGEPITIVVSPLDKDHEVYLDYPLQRDRAELSIEALNPIGEMILPCGN